MGGFVQISAGSVGSAAANAGYITRPSAAEEEDELYHNAPGDVENAETWEQTRIRLRSWADQVEAEEKARHGNRAGQPRTHYRGVLSYEDKIETEAARADAQEFLEKEFPEAQAVGVVHQDTDNTHVHIWMSARKVDGKKVHISNQDLKELHATFDQIYERRMQVPSRNAEKVEETRQFKREYAEKWEETEEKVTELFKEGVMAEDRMEEWEKLRRWADRNRPDRADPPGPEVYRQREERQHGKEVAQEVKASAEARADEQRAEQASEQEEIIEDLRSRHEKRERDRHGPRHEGGPSRDQPGADRDASASRPGERGADGAGEGQDRRRDREGAEEAPGRDREGEGRDRGGSGGDEHGGHGDEVDVGVLGRDRQSSEPSGGRDSAADAGEGGGSGNDHDGEPASRRGPSAGGDDDEELGDPKKRVWALLREGEKAKAARAFDGLDPEDKMQLTEELSDREDRALWEGRRKAMREQEGAEEAFQSLSSREQQGFEALQTAGIVREMGAPDEVAEKWTERAREVISTLDEGERQRMEGALTSYAEGVFEEVRSGIESGQSGKGQSEDESEGEDQGRSRGYDRGMGR